MLSYSRSRGSFAGVSLTGATLRPDEETNRELYGHDATNREILTGDFKTPARRNEIRRRAESGFDTTRAVGEAFATERLSQPSTRQVIRHRGTTVPGRQLA